MVAFHRVVIAAFHGRNSSSPRTPSGGFDRALAPLRGVLSWLAEAASATVQSATSNMTRKCPTALFSLTLLCSIAAVGCQQGQPGPTVRAGEIRSNPTKFSGLTVAIRGVVNSWELKQEGTFGNGYIFRDEYGDLLLVRTTNDLPKVGTELLVTGTVVTREEGADAAGQPIRTVFIAEAGRGRTGFGIDWQDSRTVLLIAIGSVLLLLLGLIVWASLRPETQAAGLTLPPGEGLSRPVLGDPGELPPDLVDQVTKTVPYEGGVVAYEKTRRMLPGVLTVMDGDRGQSSVPLYSNDGSNEVEIGRKSPDATRGIRIEDRTATLSRHQAWIKYLSGEDRFQIRNGDATNPTVLNGRQLDPHEIAELTDGSMLSMGAIKFRFAKQQ
jgi:hypothetical protein